jgi:hypothetical protein
VIGRNDTIAINAVGGEGMYDTHTSARKTWWEGYGRNLDDFHPNEAARENDEEGII